MTLNLVRKSDNRNRHAEVFTLSPIGYRISERRLVASRPMNARGASDFSRSFALHLRGVMVTKGVKQSALATHMGRSTGFVSEHLSGVRAVDTDMLDGIADLAGVDVRWLVDEVTRRMRADDDGTEETRRTAQQIVQTARERVGQNVSPDPGDSATDRRSGTA